MDKIMKICWVLIILLLVSCQANRPKKFEIMRPFVQRVNIEGMGSDSVAFYLVSIKVKPCNNVRSMGYNYWFTDGILDSVENIKVMDENKSDQTEAFRGYSKYKGKEVDALWLRKTSSGDVFQVYSCADMNELREDINTMSINLRCEYSSKKDSSFYINRLFVIPIEVAAKTLVMKMKLKSQEKKCWVNERPLRLHVYQVSYSR